MEMRRLLYFAAIIPLLIASCGKKDNIVLDKDEMASLMADIHIAEAVVDLNQNLFGDDSSKMLLKQSIYAAHGVTAEVVDSSYRWYGHHIEDYMEVYDKTIKILSNRQKELISATNEQIIIAGDSVNVWPMSNHFEFSNRAATRLVTFTVPADSNWRNNDVFTLRFNMATAKNPVTARMVIEYADGKSFYNIAGGKSKGFGEVSIRVDTTMSPVKIAGYIITQPEKNEIVRIDSISLVRMRQNLSKQYFSQRPFHYGIKPKPKKETTDSVLVAIDSTKVESNSIDKPANTPASTHKHQNKASSSAATSRQPQASKNAPSQANQSQDSSTPSSAKVANNTAKGNSAAAESLRKRNEMLQNMKKREKKQQ